MSSSSSSDENNLMITTHRPTTADELFRMPRDGSRYELIRGELHQLLPAGSQHGRFAMNFSESLAPFVRAHRLGVVYAAETGFRLSSDPDTVLAADVAFVTRERFEAAGDPPGYFPGPPDLAVEVVSPSDSYTAVDEKIAEWMEAGTRMLIIVNPRRKAVMVYRSLTDVTRLFEGDLIDGEDVVPGWTLPVEDIFA